MHTTKTYLRNGSFNIHNQGDWRCCLQKVSCHPNTYSFLLPTKTIKLLFLMSFLHMNFLHIFSTMNTIVNCCLCKQCNDASLLSNITWPVASMAKLIAYLVRHGSKSWGCRWCIIRLCLLQAEVEQALQALWGAPPFTAFSRHDFQQFLVLFNSNADTWVLGAPIAERSGQYSPWNTQIMSK